MKLYEIVHQVPKPHQDTKDVFLVMEFCDGDLTTIYDKQIGVPYKKRKILSEKAQQTVA